LVAVDRIAERRLNKLKDSRIHVTDAGPLHLQESKREKILLFFSLIRLCSVFDAPVSVNTLPGLNVIL